jgi:hypothetical protein
MVVLHGGEGTRREIDRAIEKRMGVVPLGMTGGTAKDFWDEMRSNLNAFTLGGRPVSTEDFDGLGSGDPDVATESAVALIRQAMFMDGS